MEELNFKLDIFEGPLDLLLHLLQKNKVSIYDIPISTITDQYLDYIHKMQINDMEFSSDFLVMASRLLYIKSKMLLPKHEEYEEEEEDPRQELIQNLVEYKKYKEVSSFFSDRKGICDYLYFREKSFADEYTQTVKTNYNIELLIDAFDRIMKRIEKSLPPSERSFDGIVGREPVSVKSKIRTIKHRFASKKQLTFDELYDDVESRSEIVAIFLAILEMIRMFEVTFYSKDDKIILNYGGNNGKH